MKGMKNTDRHRRHGFMLFVTCVLSFAAFLFAIDFSVLDGDRVHSQPGRIAARQIDRVPATPARQQSTPAQQPMRAILIDVIASKIKAAHLDGAKAALPAGASDLPSEVARSAEAAQNFQRLTVLRGNFGSARAPPKSA
ncbi:hypothetical protein FHS76_003736 [Ochrobactrum daejeonense]|uniref:Uncharacterized protein n=1 Tax=Brucella daejeonensis TaxID=659015 RepID=A0A7W9B071_9HYPH|nr:hypothetical protein [Brucella daejeonensis]MBB5703826.1 hypothetical protein [Brucella daejeonensis]